MPSPPKRNPPLIRLRERRRTPEQRTKDTNVAFAAIRRLYCEALPLWRTCARAFCRRHKTCAGEPRACLARTWPLTPDAEAGPRL